MAAREPDSSRFLAGTRFSGPGRSPAAPRSFGPLPIRGTPGRPARVCIATPDVVGPVRNGGIGTACTSLARALSRGGHRVTILFTGGERCEAETIGDWIRRYAGEGIEFVPMPSLPAPREFIGPREQHEAYRWLAAGDFDVVHVPEWRGTGFFALEAKRLGLAFGKTRFVVGAHSPTLWHDLEDGRAVDSDEQLSVDFLERRSVERGDVVVSPTRYLLGWMERQGWRLPGETFVQPNAFPDLPAGIRAPRGEALRPTELVFFGRLERRKGIELFADAVDRLDLAGALAGVAVTFLGKAGEVGGEDGAAWVRHRGAAWSRRPTILDGLDQAGALGYLAGRESLAVVPSLADNMPYTVVECVAAGIPLVATSVGGIPEILAEEDRARLLVPPEPGPLADRLAAALADGIAPPSPARDPDVVRREWVDWHSEVAGEIDRESPREAPASRRPLVSVCMATRNRPAMLEQAVASIRTQSHAPLELILVDDGSDDPAAIAWLDRLEPEFRERKWTLVRSEQRFPGAARNLAASKASGEWLLFMDDDNLARPTEVATLLRAAECSGAPIVTCGFDGFTGEAPPAAIEQFATRWIPLGAAMPLGLLTNPFGDTNALVRPDIFRELGGFREERGAGLVEDWAFHLGAWLRGIELAVVPEALFEYRLGPHGTGQTAPSHVSYLRGPGTLAEALPPELGLAMLFAAGVSRKWDSEEAHRLVDLHEQNVLASDFDSGTVRLSIEAADLAALEPLQQVEVRPAPGGILLRATGDDPAVRLPPFASPPTGRLILRIEAIARVPALMQLFWWVGDDPVDREERSLLVPLRPGRNVRLAEIPAGQAATRLRLDPSMRRDDVVLVGLEARGLGPRGADADPDRGPSAGPESGSPKEPARRSLARWLDARLPPVVSGRSEDAAEMATRWAVAKQLLAVGPGDAARLVPLHEIRIDEGIGAILLRATGHDPHLRLPPLRTAGPLLLHLVIEAPAATRGELFWKSPWLPFWCGRQSISVPLRKGRNDVWSEIRSTGPLFGFRFDPGEAPGDYLLRSLELRGSRG